MTAIEWGCLAMFAVSLAVFLLCFRRVDARQGALEGRVHDLERHEDRGLRRDVNMCAGGVKGVKRGLCVLQSDGLARHLALCERIDALASRVDKLERPARADAERGMLRAEAHRRVPV